VIGAGEPGARVGGTGQAAPVLGRAICSRVREPARCVSSLPASDLISLLYLADAYAGGWLRWLLGNGGGRDRCASSRPVERFACSDGYLIV
jgi:hypothetical protein